MGVVLILLLVWLGGVEEVERAERRKVKWAELDQPHCRRGRRAGRQLGNSGKLSLFMCRASNDNSLLLIVLPLTSNSDLIVSSATISRLFVYATSNLDRSRTSQR